MNFPPRSCLPGLLGEKGIFLDHIATRSRNPVDRLVKRCLKENGSLERGISGFLWAPRANLNVKRFLNMSLMSHQFSNRNAGLPAFWLFIPLFRCENNTYNETFSYFCKLLQDFYKKKILIYFWKLHNSANAYVFKMPTSRSL